MTFHLIVLPVAFIGDDVFLLRTIRSLLRLGLLVGAQQVDVDVLLVRQRPDRRIPFQNFRVVALFLTSFFR